MSFTPKVSIIIPVYNGSNYMREAIDSALAQIYKNVEVIVVNDGSDDGGKTEGIARSYGDKIRYFYKENGGVSTALNKGIREMTGEYFSWLSHDDYYFPGKIEKQIKFIEDHRDAKVLFCKTGIMDETGRVLKSKLTTMKEFVEDRLPSHKKKQYETFRGGISFFDAWIYACSLLVHKSCFEKTGFINEQNRTTQDTEFVLLLLNCFEVYSLPELLVYRRDHQASGFYRQRELNIKESEKLWKHY